MQPDDIFTARLATLIGDAAAWLTRQRDVAEVDETRAPLYWRLAAQPFLAGACPIEIVVYRRQGYDIALAGETYEDLATDDLELLPLVLQAIEHGRVLRRSWLTLATGSERSVETIVTYPGGKLCWERRVEPFSRLVEASQCHVHDRHYLPYRST